MFDLYREQILERSREPRFAGQLAAPTNQADGENRSCGDVIHIEINVQEGIMQEIRHECRACAICSATTDLLIENLQGKPVSEIEIWNTEKITELLGIPLSPVRLKCALLPLETIKSSLKEA